MDNINVARWFDMVQFKLQSSNVFESISIPKSVPAQKNNQSQKPKPKPKAAEPAKGNKKKNKKNKQSVSYILYLCEDLSLFRIHSAKCASFEVRK